MSAFAQPCVCFTGFGASSTMRFFSFTGTNLGQPASAPVPGAGVDGIIALSTDPSALVAVVGGAGPNFPTTGVGLFNADFTVNTQCGTGPHGAPSRSSARDDLGHFYGASLTALTSGWTGGIAQYDGTGTQTASWNLAAGGAGSAPAGEVQAFAISGDGRTAWYAVSLSAARPTTVYQFSLASNTYVGAFAALAGYTVASHNALLWLENGHVLVGWSSATGGTGILREYAADGSTVMDYTLPGTVPMTVINLTPSLTPTTTFWATYYNAAVSTSSGVTVAEIPIGSGTPLHSFAPSDTTFQFDSPACVLAAMGTATITSVTPPPCGTTTTQTITISGSSFPASPTVTLTDSHSATIANTVVSATSTSVVVSAVFVACGTWNATVGGSAAFPFTTVSPSTYLIRRLRRFMLPWDEAHRQKTISRLELIGQVGIGDSVTTDPLVMLRISRDGGMTWGTEQHLHVGQMGQYLTRLYLTRLGRARNPVVEITTSDPVAWAWVECLVDLSEGTS